MRMNTAQILGALNGALAYGVGQKAAQKNRDAEQIRQAGADVTPEMNTPGDGMGPSAAMVGTNAYGTTDEANAAENSEGAKVARIKGALLSQGKVDQAVDLENKFMQSQSRRRAIAKEMESEGTMDFIGKNLIKAPSVEEIERGDAADFDLDGVDDFNKTGKAQLPPGSKGRWKVRDLGNGRKVADFSLVKPDGVVSPFSAREMAAINGMTLAEREKLDDSRYIDGRRLDMQQQGVDIQRQYKDGMLAVAQNRAETYENGYGKAGKGGVGRDKMSEVDKEEFDLYKAQAQKIDENIMRAEADGTWEPSKNPSQFALLQKREIALRKTQGILERYRSVDPSAGQPKADPFGVRGKVGGQTAAQGQSGAPMPESGQGGGSDRFRIINAELQKAMQAQAASAPGSDDWKRETSNVEALKQEIGRLPMSERGQVAQAVAQKAGRQTTAQASAQAGSQRSSEKPVGQQAPQLQTSRGVLDLLLPTPKAQTNQQAEIATKIQAAKAAGFEPTNTFGNSGMFGKPERLYINSKTGQRLWESQLLQTP